MVHRAPVARMQGIRNSFGEMDPHDSVRGDNREARRKSARNRHMRFGPLRCPKGSICDRCRMVSSELW
jgi:hypothetical protein